MDNPKILKQSQPQNEMQKAYITSLSDKEKVAYKIAVNFLESSFDLEKSLGYKKYEKNQKNK